MLLGLQTRLSVQLSPYKSHPMKKHSLVLLTSLLLLMTHLSLAQKADYRPKKVDGASVESRASPMAIASAKKGDAYIKIVYSRPHLRKREMIGSRKVPYGKVWRLGANESTEITLTTDILIGGKALKAGTYSMYCIPEEGQWTIIFNTELGKWGSFGYDEKKDVLRITQKTTKAIYRFEPLTMWINERGLHIAWDTTQIDLSIEL